MTIVAPTLAPFPTAFKGDFVIPSSPDYSQSIRRWAKNAQRNAAVVAYVKDEEDVHQVAARTQLVCRMLSSLRRILSILSRMRTFVGQRIR